MKHFVLISLLSCFFLNAEAQLPSARAVFALKGQPMLMSGQSHSANAGKNTAIKYRLSKQEEYNDYGKGNLLTDSARFIYSGSRGSINNHNPSGVNMYNLDAGPSTDFLYVSPASNSIDSSMQSFVSFDSLLHYTFDTVGGPLRFAHAENRIYNSDGSVNTATISTHSPGGTVVDGYRQVILYNAGRISKVYSMSLNGTGYDTASVRIIGYDAAGNAILDSTATKKSGAFQPDTRTLYTYNAAGAYLTLTWQQYVTASSSFWSTNRDTYTYLPSGLLHTNAREHSSGPGQPLVLGQIDSFGYSPGVPGYTSSYTRGYFPDGTPGSYSRTTTDHYASNGLKDSLTYSDVATNTAIFTYKMTYDAMGNMASILAYDLQNSPKTEMFEVKYYYEPYENNLSIGMATPSRGLVSLFPNPASGHITLSYPDAKRGEKISVHITNASGQMVHSETLTMQGTSQQILLGDEAAPGTYYLSVSNAQGGRIGTQSFLKL